MSLFRSYWHLLEYPLRFIDKPIADWIVLSYKILATLFLLWIVWGILIRIKDKFKKTFTKDSLVDPSDYDPYTSKNLDFRRNLDASDHLLATIEPMIARKQYKEVGDVFASLNQSKDAAKWYKKAGDLPHAAEHFAKDGQTLKAAQLLLKSGDYDMAARFYEEKGKYRAAAKAYEAGGDLPAAAQVYADAGNPREAARKYAAYFEQTGDAPDVQLKRAEACFKVLDSDRGRAKVRGEVRAKLLAVLAERFNTAQRFDLAARLYQEAGLASRAGDVYIQAGKFEEAAQCLRDAGREGDANQMMGRYFESQQRWHEAGDAYAQGGELRKAGDCFSKANDQLRAAECYEKVQDFYRAALDFVRAKNYEAAVRALKQMPGEDPNYENSRVLIGRCYYALKDFALCAAALENSLGTRITPKNIEYFKILARAYNNLGKYDDALGILRKVKALSLDSEDLDEQISMVEMRVSQANVERARTQVTSTGGPAPSGSGQDPQMSMVESALGQRFKIEQELGRGGMGVVYLARDTQLDRPVALKFLGALVDDSDEFRERFVREAQAAAKVSHPNIISIYDIGADRGKVYITMEYVDGPSLHRLVRAKGKLGPREAARIIAQACDALDAVHKAGIIHRDIKPDNILLDKDGRVKLMDFGLAKASDSRLTMANQILGTPCYMAPEQARGEALDGRADIYAMGLVLHEALTGIVYFSKGNILVRQQSEMPNAPSSYNPDVPEALDRVVMKAVAKKREERYQTASELRMALRPFE